MRVQSTVKPDALLYQHRFDGQAEIRMRENVTSTTDKDAGNVMYQYDEYVLVMQDRVGLEKIVSDNLPVWLAYAKQDEYDRLAADVRKQRDKLLSDTDWTQTDDAPLVSADRESMRQYRQALRDITSQSGFPQTINWPEKPAVATAGGQSEQLDRMQQVTELQAQIAQLITDGGK